MNTQHSSKKYLRHNPISPLTRLKYEIKMYNPLQQNRGQPSVLNLIKQQLMVMTQQLDLLQQIQHSSGSANCSTTSTERHTESNPGEEAIHIPPSPGQRDLWFWSNLGADKSSAYNQSVVMRLRGELQIPLLKAAMQTVVARRDALRIISISSEEQIIAATLQIEIPCLVLPEASENVKQQQIDAWLEAVTSQPFNFKEGPFFRLQLAQVNHRDYLMVLVAHHLIADGWSIEVILQEVAELYSTLCVGRQADKPKPVQYQSYLDWLLTLQTSQQLEQDHAYWLEVWSTSIPKLVLPSDFLKPARTYNGDRQTLTLNSAVYEQLKRFSQTQGTTVVMTLLAAWTVFLSRLTGQEQLVVGIPTAGQLLMGARDLVGHCSSLLPIVSNPRWDLEFTEFLASVKKTLFDAHEHQRYFFIDRLSQVHPQSVTAPQVTTLFNIDKMMDIPKLHGLDVALMPSPVHFAKFDLSLNSIQHDDQFVLDFTYRTDLFDPQTIRHWCHAFLTLLAGILASPESRLYQLPLVLPEDHQTFFSDVDSVQDVEPIHQQFERQVSQNPDAIAVTVGDESISYTVLNYRANQLARYLKAQEAAQSHVTVYLQHPIQLAIAVLALFKGGMSVTLINPGLSAEAIRMATDEWVEGLLLTEASLITALTEGKSHSGTHLVAIDDDWSIISTHSSENLQPINSEGYIDFLYATASTEIDRLQLSYLAVCRHIAGLQKLLPHTSRDRISIFNQFEREDFAIFDFLLSSLTVGASLNVIAWQQISDSENLAVFADKTSTMIVASLTDMVALARAFSVNPKLLMVSKPQQWVIFDQGKLGYGLVKQLSQCLDCLGQPVELYWVYKLPVLSLVGAVKQLVSLPEEPRGNSQAVPLGHPIAQLGFSVRDAYDQILPVGIPGRLCVEYPSGMAIPTGDKARLRFDRGIEICGDKATSPREIELTLSLCSGVKEVVVRESQPQGADAAIEFRVYVVLTKAEGHDLQKVEQLLNSLLSIPESFRLIQVETIPRTASGVVDYSALSEIPGVSLTGGNFVAPGNSTEKAIAHYIQQTLGKPLVSVDDNFFDLGLSSLQGTQLISRIQAELAVDISLRDLFEAPNIASLATRIKDRTTPPLPLMQPLPEPADAAGMQPPFRDYDLSPAQRSLWLHAQLDESAIAYNLSTSLLLEGDLEITALQRSFQSIVARYESLRTTFVLVEEEPRQRVHETMPVPQTDLDLSEAENSLELAGKYGLEEAQKPFDLAQGPLLRTLLLKLSDTRHILLFTTHHLIIDGWSLDILGRELFNYYATYRSGQNYQPSPLSIQYKDYAAWHNALLQTDRLVKQRDYWHNKLLGSQPALNLPTDFPRPSVPTFKGSVMTFTFDPGQTAALNRLSRNYGASLYMLLVTAVKTLLYRITQQTDIIVGTTFADRPHPDLEEQIGCFINPLILRDIIAVNQSFVSLLHQVRQTILEALENTLYPFDLLVNELQQRDLSLQGSSLFEVQVVMHNHPQTYTQGDGLKVSIVENIVLASRFDLIFNFIENDDQLQLDIEYKTDLWKPERIEVMKNRFYALVIDILAHPHQILDNLNIQTAYEESAEEPELLFDLDF